MRIITKPISYKDEIVKSRHITGFSKWARSSPLIGFIMLVLGWFTIPFEVIFRRDFGQRWFSTLNYYAGLLLMGIVEFIDIMFIDLREKLHEWWSYLFHNLDFYHETSTEAMHDVTSLYALEIIASIYLYLGLYHLFKIRWRNQVNIPLHSFDDGTSRLSYGGESITVVLNIFAWPVMAACYYPIPRNQRSGKPFPKLIPDHEAFTNVVFEPAIVLLLAWNLHGVVSLWLFLSGISLFIHAHWKELARKNKMLDFQDSRIEAQTMRELKATTTKGKAPVIKKPKKNEAPVPQFIVHYPALDEIIEGLNKEKVGVAR